MASDENEHDQGDDDTLRVLLQPALPCGMHACGRPAAVALAEPDLAHPGLWTFLPVCAECAARIQRLSDEPVSAYENAKPPVLA